MDFYYAANHTYALSTHQSGKLKAMSKFYFSLLEDYYLFGSLNQTLEPGLWFFPKGIY